MLYVIKWVYMWILPLGGIIAALLAVNVYVFRRRGRGRFALLIVTAVLYLLAVQPVSDLILRPLETRYDQVPLSQLQGDVLILLGGGARAGVPDVDGTGQVGEAAANRFLTALRLQKAKQIPIILSGGAVFSGDANEAAIEKRMLLSLGVAEADIFTDEKSHNTAENATFSNLLCRQNHWRHPIVVTSAFHMPRAGYFFTREGVSFTPYPCDYRTSAEYRWSPYSFIPQAYILFNSCLAVKEYVGLAAARLNLQ